MSPKEITALTPDKMRERNKKISRQAVSQATGVTTHRPQAFSLWSPDANPQDITDYTSWPCLVDRSYSVRHLAPQDTSNGFHLLPEDHPYVSSDDHGAVTALFKRETNQFKASRSSLLFPYFAQWFTDSFLRTNSSDRRRTTSNHEIDMCQLYGLTESTARILRTLNGDGKLKSQKIREEEFLPDLFDNNGCIKTEFLELPYVRDGTYKNILNRFNDSKSRKKHYFATGLERGNSTFGYAAISTLFLREHNRLCEELKVQNALWDDERLFQTARMIVIILELKIVIEEYINHISAPPDNPQMPRPFVFDNSFAEKQNWYRANRISIEFDLLYRWHSLIPDVYVVGNKNYMPENFLLNNKPLIEHGLAKILHSASAQPAGQIGLFNTPEVLLPAEYSALKMARDFKIRSYNEYCNEFSVTPKANFAELTSDKATQKALDTLYGEINKLEFFVGLFAEEPAPGRLFGSLMSNMVAYDALTQALTNPLLSTNIYNAGTLTEYGLLCIEQTASLDDIWKRNGGDHDAEAVRLSMDLLAC